MRGSGRGRSHDFFSGNSSTKRSQKTETSSSETRTRDAAVPKPSMLLSRPREEEKGPAVAIASRSEAESRERQRVQQAPKVLPSNREGPAEREMFDSRRLINDGMMFEETIMEYLTENPHFTVTAAIGPQTVGKSTILSMLAGNNPQDKYRYYVFRPASREAVESSRYQTTKIHVYVSKSRGIFLDCQGTNSSSIVEDSYRHSRKSDERSETTAYVECLQLVSFLLQVSTTILVCSDYTVDMELVKILRTAEMLRANLNHVSNLPQLNFTRKTNIVFVHVRANSVDFAYEVHKDRIQLIRRLFADSLRLRVSENDDSVLFLLSVLKPRKDVASQLHSHHHQKERSLEAEEVEKFEVGIRKIRFQLAAMPQDPFSEQLFTEKHWLLLARYIWKEAAFTSSIEKLASYFGG